MNYRFLKMQTFLSLTISLSTPILKVQAVAAAKYFRKVGYHLKLDLNCVRDILSAINDYTKPMYLPPDEFCKLLPEYNPKEIVKERKGGKSKILADYFGVSIEYFL